ncbi:probable glutathione S-transferase [Beta vulgaris subsp. vulgaris]|uniref:probable glutathione S-transferase n=1 Tax=Beta vulgaris subsp. vulgaris TaxID=3555 RepID=UPI0020366837|nr:probable glutathione S-transferase [Beta vulgaris subsp. vulgaris]
MENVKLFGVWSSPFCSRVILALELKGIKYEYIEEDLTNKSSLLLDYNPVQKKVPVLVHNGNPICESLIILEYLEEMWPNQLPLLPKDPYQRAVVRFWAKFAEEKGIAIWIFFQTTRVDDQAKAGKDCLDMLRTLEEYGLENNTFFGGENIGIADLAIGTAIYWLQIFELTLKVKLFEASNFPRLYRWFNHFKEVPQIKSNLPNQDQMLLFFNKLRVKLKEATSM